MDERSCLPGFSARQGEQEVHGVVCISDGDGLGRASPLAPQPPAAPSAGRKALGVEMCWLFIGTDRAGVEALPCT